MTLTAVLAEIRQQTELAPEFPPGRLSFDHQMERLRGLIEDHGEYGIAYEDLVSILDDYPFQLSDAAAELLLEARQLMGIGTKPQKDDNVDSQ